MKNAVQVVDTMPTADGQWVTFWHLDAGRRVSGEIASTGFSVEFDLGDVFACLGGDPETTLDIVGPVSPDLLMGDVVRLPVVIEQLDGARHGRMRRFEVEHDRAEIREKLNDPALASGKLTMAKIEALREDHLA